MIAQFTVSAKPFRGQSLVEFVLILPIMIIILLGAFCFGLGTYQAHMTSDAIQLPLLRTMEMANLPEAVDEDKLKGYISSGGLNGSLAAGNLVDSIKPNPTTGILIAQKNYIPLVSIIPGFTISVGHSVNPSLLKPTASGGNVRPMATPWVPGGVMQPPPWAAQGATPPPATPPPSTTTPPP
jgi:hypothetical protein